MTAFYNGHTTFHASGLQSVYTDFNDSSLQWE